MAGNKCLWFAVFCFFGVLCSLQICRLFYKDESAMEESKEETTGSGLLNCFFVENNRDIPTNGMGQGTTQSARTRVNHSCNAQRRNWVTSKSRAQ